MGRIFTLDSKTVSKIAAGEIIESPASIVKEMLENAIDAKATIITVDIRGTADEYIRITDNGEGILEDDIELAFTRHATSKINSINDLNDLHTLGFRGEALYSISHVSELEIISRTKDSNYATKLLFKFGDLISKEKIGAPIGTTFIVKNIFENLPARKKFLKKDSIEYSRIAEVVEKIALSSNLLSIKLIRNSKTTFHSHPNKDPLNHIYSVLGREIASNLTPIIFDSTSYKIRGFFSNNRVYHSNRNYEYIFVNGRFVKNLEIAKAIEKFYYTKIPLQRYPIFLLYIEIDPVLIDVNIHPKKHEVKLSNQNQLIPIIEKIYKDTFEKTLSVPEWKDNKEMKPKIETPSIFELFNESQPGFSTKTEEFTDFKSTEGIDNDNLENNDNIKIVQEATKSYLNNEPLSQNENIEVYKHEDWSNLLMESRYVGTLFKTFLILEHSTDSTCFFIDQHAAHERVLFEKYLKQFNNEDVHRQILLSPEIVKCTPKEIAILEEFKEEFKRFGFVYELFGETDVLLREVPFLFGMPTYMNFILDLIGNIQRVSNKYDLNHYDIMRKACRAAVKAGDTLSEAGVYSLIKQLLGCSNPYSCPHGRPCIIKMKKRDLEKNFLRIENYESKK